MSLERQASVKSLFCQKLIRDWADNKLFQSRANAEVPDFKFAYLLTFRQLNLLGDDPVTLEDILSTTLYLSTFVIIPRKF